MGEHENIGFVGFACADLLEKEWKYGVTAFVGGVLVCVLWSGVYAANIQRGIADGVVRFHVLANSDTAADQNLKLDVRDAVLASFGEKLEGCSSKGESMVLLAAYKEEICQTAAAEIARQGYDYPVSVSLVREDFPEKTYGNLVFPAGVYDAVRIEIGEAKGHNWWCVLYPRCVMWTPHGENPRTKGGKDCRKI